MCWLGRGRQTKQILQLETGSDLKLAQPFFIHSCHGRAAIALPGIRPIPHSRLKEVSST